jgi:hypothetical protein
LNVRFWGLSRHFFLRCKCPLLTQSGRHANDGVGWHNTALISAAMAASHRASINGAGAATVDMAASGELAQKWAVARDG